MGHFASVLIAKHNGEEFILKEIFYKQDEKRNKFSKRFKILNDLKIQKVIVLMVDYAVSRSFPLVNFLLHQVISLTNLDQFLFFTDNFLMVSFGDIISKCPFDIMKLAYRDLKLGNVLPIFLIRKPFSFFFFCLSLNFLNITLAIRLRFS